MIWTLKWPIPELAKEQGVNQFYACRMLRLTLLSPSIVESLLDRRGTNLTLEALMKPLPAIWDAQFAD